MQRKAPNKQPTEHRQQKRATDRLHGAVVVPNSTRSHLLGQPGLQMGDRVSKPQCIYEAFKTTNVDRERGSTSASLALRLGGVILNRGYVEIHLHAIAPEVQ